MSERNSATHGLGLERFGPHIRGVVLHQKRNRIECEEFFLLDSPKDSEAVIPLRMTDQGMRLKAAVKKALTVTAVEGMQVVIRQLEVKLKKEDDIDAVLSFQAEPLLPLPVEEMQLDRLLIQETEDGTLLTLLAVSKDYLHGYLNEWQEIGIDPEVVGALPQALALFARMALNSPEVFLIIHSGYHWTTYVLVQNGKLLAAQVSKGGLHELQVAYQHDIGEEVAYDAPVLITMDYEALNTSQLPTLADVIGQMKREAIRTAFGLVKYAHVGDISGVISTGEGVLYPSLMRVFASAIDKRQIALTPPPHLAINPELFCRLAAPIGLALTALPNQEKEQINFRYGEMAYPHPWKRLRLPLAITIGLCAILALTTYQFGEAYLVSQEARLRNTYVDLVSNLRREYADIEKQFPNQESTNPSQLTTNDIESRIRLLERQISSAPETIALFPNIPRVTDVLIWLSHHPNVRAIDQGNAQIRIESFNYRMLKRPEINRVRDHYQVQVELEFVSDSSRAARLFYDSLIGQNDFVDTKNEVKWTATGGKFRVVFFLKDKTSYPNA